MIDMTEGKLAESLEFAIFNNDNTLQECIDRLKWDEQNYKSKPIARVFNECFRREHCFEFSLVDDSTNRLVLYGGIIYHGKEGELQNGSVQIEPSGGWQIHT